VKKPVMKDGRAALRPFNILLKALTHQGKRGWLREKRLTLEKSGLQKKRL
jgi:hypothetical protein